MCAAQMDKYGPVVISLISADVLGPVQSHSQDNFPDFPRPSQVKALGTKLLSCGAGELPAPPPGYQQLGIEPAHLSNESDCPIQFT